MRSVVGNVRGFIHNLPMEIALIAGAAVLGVLIGLLIGYLLGGRSSAGLRAQNNLLTAQLATAQDSAAAKQSLDAMLAPLRKELETLRAEARQAEIDRVASATAISSQLANVHRGYETLDQNTRAIAGALSRGQTRGQWGEMQLEQLLTSAGMLEGVHFERQNSTTVGDDGIRPDIIVNLPDLTKVPVDAKFPFDAYWRSLETQDAEEAAALRAKHARDVLDHASTLSRKKYADAVDGPNFVVLFIPLESILQAAMVEDPLLLEKCFSKNVILASPSSMLGLLRTIAFGWSRNQLAANARQIGEVASGMLIKISKLGDQINKIARGLESATRAYNDFASAMDNSVFNEARRLRDLGVNVASELEEPSQISLEVREYQGKAGELVEGN